MLESDDALAGGFANPSVDAAHAFRAALNAMARPGTIETVDLAKAPAPMSAAAAALVLTLCDGETPIWLSPSHDTDDVRTWIAFHTGAPITSRDTAQFAIGPWDQMMPLGDFPIGTPEYPDRSATLIVEVETLEPSGARLTGPGIEVDAHLSIPDHTGIHANRAAFPCGLDFFFTSGRLLAALPRTTIVTTLAEAV
ncbi:MAG: phosphonate C-P lyase system protein PhnH [Pelagimonas sp.]|uniref:phosphonate C-P lyase system protein PhnH n=1 Tax=Pelagimonas sp. TaxID=2073170 RepID=UPI003D6BBAB8